MRERDNHIILSSGILPKSEMNGGDDMADIAKKISKLDEKSAS